MYYVQISLRFLLQTGTPEQGQRPWPEPLFHYKRIFIIYQQGVGGWGGGGAVPQLINNNRSLNEPLALSC